jgi:hypothetical protein
MLRSPPARRTSRAKMRSAIAALIVAVCVALPLQSLAQQVACSEQDPTEHLAGSFNERVVAYGTSDNASVLIRIFGNIVTGSWTMVMSRAAPIMHCIIGAGHDFEVVDNDAAKPKGTSAGYAF